MTKKITTRTLLLAAALGLAGSTYAQGTAASAPTPAAETGKGLLGQSYVNLGYSYTDMHQSSVNYQGLNFEYNQPLNTGFDLNLSVGDAWSSKFSGTRARQQTVGASAIAFTPGLSWGRPYIGVGAGWIWTNNAGVHDNSFLYGLQAGVEFQATKELSITPYVSYTDASSLRVNNKWGYGVKANYWLTDQWGLTAGIGRDNQVNTGYSVGTTFRF
jgi:outer membrane protein W